jgi:hypothetical protein|tara:strand:- start:214 stop:414 length:201 start_codon:yes stop_codon:yes gene_type:complete
MQVSEGIEESEPTPLPSNCNKIKFTSIRLGGYEYNAAFVLFISVQFVFFQRELFTFHFLPVFSTSE